MKSYRVLTIILAVLVISAIGAFAAAALAQSDGDVIYAAVNERNGNMRIVSGPDAKLRPQEVLLQWNQVGPAGPPGEEGPAGADGTDGVSVLWLGTLDTAPSDPALNNAYYNSTDGASYIWDGDSWEILAQDGADGTSTGPVLGEWTEVPLTWTGQYGCKTNHLQADTDGLVVAVASHTPGSVSNSYVSLTGKTGPYPITDYYERLGYARVLYAGTITMPVRKGDGWLVQGYFHNSVSYSTTAEVYWIPLGD